MTSVKELTSLRRKCAPKCSETVCGAADSKRQPLVQTHFSLIWPHNDAHHVPLVVYGRFQRQIIHIGTSCHTHTLHKIVPFASRWPKYYPILSPFLVPSKTGTTEVWLQLLLTNAFHVWNHLCQFIICCRQSAGLIFKDIREWDSSSMPTMASIILLSIKLCQLKTKLLSFLVHIYLLAASRPTFIYYFFPIWHVRNNKHFLGEGACHTTRQNTT